MADDPGKPINPTEFSEAWYSVDEIFNCINQSRSVFDLPGSRCPEDVHSREYAEWMTKQYRLAMAKGIQVANDRHEALKKEADEFGAFERETIYRLVVEACRVWVVGTFLSLKRLPKKAKLWIYSNGPLHSIDWGNSPGPDDPDIRPMRYKKIQVTLEIIDDK